MSYITIAFAVIMVISALVGLTRGFFKSLTNLVALVAGIFLSALLGYKLVDRILAIGFIESLGKIGNVIAVALGYLAVFLLVYIVLKIIFSLINRLINRKLGVVNRLFGMLFNLAIGFVTVLVLIEVLRVFDGWGPIQSLFANARNASEPIGKWLIDNDWLSRFSNYLARNNSGFASLVEYLQKLRDLFGGSQAQAAALLRFAVI